MPNERNLNSPKSSIRLYDQGQPTPPRDVVAILTSFTGFEKENNRTTLKVHHFLKKLGEKYLSIYQIINFMAKK
jgi:hypothetical protein